MTEDGLADSSDEKAHDDWMETLAIAEQWHGRGGGPSRIEIQVLARALPAFFEKIGNAVFDVSRLTRFINFRPRFHAYAWETRDGGKLAIVKEKRAAREAGKTVVDTQDACHTFSHRDTFFLQTDRNVVIQPLDKDLSDDMRYRFRPDEMAALAARASESSS